MSTDLLEPLNCACFNIRRAARKVTQNFDRALKPAGIHATQFTLLAVLAGTDNKDGIPMTDLAKKLGMDRTTLTRNLGGAERAKWVTIKLGDDRRERLVTLTPAGLTKFETALPRWVAAQERILHQLGETGLAELLTLTRQLDAN